jgi:diguanylate cyclase (GGDEF)-like protein
MLGTFPRKLANWIGWNSRRGSSPAATATPQAGPPLSARDVGTAVELFSRLAEITASVSSEVKHHSGSIQSVNDELSCIPHGDVSAVAAAVCKLLVMNQQTQQRLAHAELRLQAQQRQLADVASAAKTDPLTGLANRRGLDEDMAVALTKFQQKGRPTALLMLDIDHFKRFNDRHGHLVGDQALKRLSDVLLSQAREADVVARFGGEEFAVIFHGATAMSILERAENMRRSISQSPITVNGHELRISASAGISELQSGDTAETAFQRADEALYAAKLDGRDCCYWHAEDRLQRVSRPAEEPAAAPAAAPSEKTSLPAPFAEPAAAGPKPQGVELAADQFADASFIGQVSRRVAEWRRGGSTFSVALLRVAFATGSTAGATDEARRTALRIVNQFARASLRDMDLVTRWNEDGLAILLPGSLVTDAAGVANRLRTAIEKHEMPAPHGGLKLSLSAGVAEVIEGNDAHRVLRRAWQALDSATAAGGGQVHLHDGLRPATMG